MLLLERGFDYMSSKDGAGSISYNTKEANLAKSRQTFYKTINDTDEEAWIVMDPLITITSEGILCVVGLVFCARAPFRSPSKGNIQPGCVLAGLASTRQASVRCG